MAGAATTWPERSSGRVASTDKLIERYERLLADDEWPDSQEKARRAVRALVNGLKREVAK
jgi:hypothetical protein